MEVTVKKFYNLVCFFLRIIGTLFISVLCCSRLVFYRDWQPCDDILFWTCVIGILVVNYTLIFIGKRILVDKYLEITKTIELILMSIPIIFLVFMIILPWIRVPFGAMYPPPIICAAIMLLRTIGKTGDGSLS